MRIIEIRKQEEEAKQNKMMESFRAILSDSISFLFPAMLAIFTSSFDFDDYEKPILIMVFSMGALLILLNMILAHGVEDGVGRTNVVSFLTLLTVIYVFGVFEYFLYKFFPAGEYQITALHCMGAHFIFGVFVITWLWGCSFKINTVCSSLGNLLRDL